MIFSLPKKLQKKTVHNEIVIQNELVLYNEAQLFGTSLSSIHQKFLHSSGIPKIVEVLVQVLEDKGTEIKGIFRVPGTHTRVFQLQEMFSNG